MPTLSRWLIRTALACCVAAFLLGLALAAPPIRALTPALAAAWPAYIHLLVVGWITQLIMGVAYWMFPRGRGKSSAGDAAGWASYALLNAGLFCRVVAEPLAAAHPGRAVGWLLPVSAALQLAAVLCFVANIWPRVRSR